MKPQRSVFAIGSALLVLAAASMLDAANVRAPEVSLMRSDRLDGTEEAAQCSFRSFLAACAAVPQAEFTHATARGGSAIQVFEKPGETILVRVKRDD